MLNRRQTFKNATLTVAQVVVSATFLFVIYKYLLATLGAARLGVWSIVMALSTVARITDLGFAGGMTRFVAKYRSLEEHETVLELVETGTVSLAVLSTLVLAAAYPLLQWGLPLMFDDSALDDARALLPFSLASFGLLAVAGAFLSTLDGLQRADLRNMVLIGGTLAYGMLIPTFVSTLGFAGLGWAQLGQAALVLAASWVVVRRQLEMKELIPTRWRRKRFSEMLSYNVNLQLSTVASFLGDPLTKVMLGHFGNLPMVGYYEMASKMVSQFRAVVTNVNQVFVPVIAHLHEKDKTELAELYEKTYGVLFFVCVTFYCAAAIATPSISTLWLGHYDPFFVSVAYVMLLTMFINTLTAPAYFSNMGTGHAAVNALSQVVIGGANLTLGWLLGRLFGGPGVIVAYAIAVVAGSAFLMHRFLRMQALPASTTLPRSGRGSALLAIGLTVAVTSFVALSGFRGNPVLIAVLVVGLALLGLITYRSPLKINILHLLRRKERPV